METFYRFLIVYVGIAVTSLMVLMAIVRRDDRARRIAAQAEKDREA